MAFTQELRFSDLSKLMEAVATNKSVKKRDEFVTDYFKKLHKFRKEFIDKNKDKVSWFSPSTSVLKCRTSL